MEERILKTLFIIGCVGLIVSAFIFIIIVIISKEERVWALSAGFICIVLSNLFNVVRIYKIEG